MAYDIPRPEGYDVLLYNAGVASAQAGYDFSRYTVVSVDDQYADMYFVTGTAGPVMRVDTDTDIQDMGPTSSSPGDRPGPCRAVGPPHMRFRS